MKEVMPVVTYTSSAQRQAPLRTRCTNRLTQKTIEVYETSQYHEKHTFVGRVLDVPSGPHLHDEPRPVADDVARYDNQRQLDGLLLGRRHGRRRTDAALVVPGPSTAAAPARRARARVGVGVGWR